MVEGKGLSATLGGDSVGRNLRRHIRDVALLDYVHSASSGPGVLDCSLGVNPFGHSPTIDPAQAVREVDFHQYPPFPYDGLTDAIRRRWNGLMPLARRHIRVCGGSMLILNWINQLFIDAGDVVLGYSPQFPQYVNSARLAGADYRAVPVDVGARGRFDAGPLVESLRSDHVTLVYLDNPNNPTGQVIPRATIERIVGEARRVGTCVIVDEAYGEYMDDDNSAIGLLADFDNVLVVRSFSKGHGLAGARIGYVVAGEELMEYFSLIDDYLLNPVALPMAERALDDRRFVELSRRRTAHLKRALTREIAPLRTLPTDDDVPIFVLLHPDPRADLAALLREVGVIASSGYEGLGSNAVRLRIPAELEPLRGRLQSLARRATA